MRSIARLSLCTLLALTAEHAASAQSLDVVQHVVFTAGVSGHLAAPVCHDGTDFEAAPFAAQGAAIAAASAGEASFTFDTGGLFAPHGVGRYATEHAPETLVAMSRGLGYDALAFAVKDLQTNRGPMLALARALREAGTPYVASNLRCEGAGTALCEAVDDASDPLRIVASGAERVAFIALVDPAVLSHVAEENRQGLSLEPLAEAMHRRVEEARAAGATLVVASVDNGAGARAAGEAIALAESLPEADRPDLLVAARAGRQLLYARPRTFQPPIASAPPGRAASVEVRRRSDVGLEMLVRPVEPVPEGDNPVATAAAAIGPRYCRDLGQPYAGGHLGSALDRAGFADLVAGSMRIASDAEIALVNLPMVEDDFARPSGHALTPSDLQLALQFDEPLVRATVDAAYLTTLARAIAAHPEVRAVGLAIANPNAASEAITINGRAIDARASYTVVMPRFLATGGDGVVPSGPTFHTTDATARGALATFLAVSRDGDPRGDLPDLARRLEWSFAFASDTSFGESTISNPGGYGDTQFDRADNIAYGTENQLDLVARSTRLSWENQAILRYRTTQSRNEPRAEADDLISFRSTFAYREPRTRHAVWYVPEPYGEAYLETEFTVPDTRPARHFLVRPTLGARFTLTSVLSLKVQAGGAFEVFDESVDPAPGIGSVLTLSSWQFFSAGKRSGTLEGTFDWFLAGLGVTTPVHTMRGNLVLGIQLNRVLGLSFTSTLFGVKSPDQDFSLALNTTANLRLRWFVRTQH